jgi:hypothetical protein
MKVAGVFSFNGGMEFIKANKPELLNEVEMVISKVDAKEHLTKESAEKTMMGKMLYNPITLNKAIKKEFTLLGWQSIRIKCDYPKEYYVNGYKEKHEFRGAFREMDFVKEKVGIEFQFGKYSFMVYNVAAKMTIFHNLGYIDSGIEIVPVKELAENMSSGVSYFEQFVWDLKYRGVSDIDIPVLILGVVY